MKISSAYFIKGAVGPDEIFRDGKPQVAFIGRSNVGKSSVINSLIDKKGLARTSSLPGRTREINIFLINNSFYFVDLPGYGFAKITKEIREKINSFVHWYFFELECDHKKIFLIIDAEIGPTGDDLDMLYMLEKYEKDVIVIANKIDKIKKSEYKKKIEKIRVLVGKHTIIPFSAKEKIGINNVWEELSE